MQKRLEQVQQQARNGDVDAQATLGLMYETGFGVAPDRQHAAKWYKKAALQGDQLSQFALAEMHLEGKGVAPNAETAVYWLRKAAGNGLPDACFLLGNLLLSKKNQVALKEGIRWLEVAAESGMAKANLFLGDLFAKGSDVEEDKDRAMRYYRNAAEQAYAEMRETAQYVQAPISIPHTSNTLPTMGASA